jgi:uncharacterized protein
VIDPSNEYAGLQVTFNTTENCNLACSYCYEINKKPRTLTLDKAKKFVDILLSDPDPIQVMGTDDYWMLKQGLTLDFIGGDALIDVELVDSILEYFQDRVWELGSRWKDRWRVSISTNGTLFEKKGVKEFMEKYLKNLSIGVSVDGCPAVHDKNRTFVGGQGSMSTILKSWDWYTDWVRRSNSALSTKSTLNLDSIPYLRESVEYMHKTLGIKYINMNFIMEKMDIQASDLQKLEEQLDLVKSYVLDNRHDIFLGLFQVMNLGKPMECDPDQSCKGRCGSGAMPALGINGKIYPCFRYLTHTVAEGRADFNVGDVDSGLSKKSNFAVVRAASREAVSDDECKACPIESMCPYCIGGCYAEFGEFKRTKYVCEIAKIQDKYAKLYWREYDKLEGTHTENAYYPTYEEYQNGRATGV